jgi:hypothetical protein
MRIGRAKMLRKRIFNDSYTVTVSNISIGVRKNDSNRVLVESGGVSIRPWPNCDWTTMTGSNSVVFGDFTPRMDQIFEIKLAIPESLSKRGRYNIGLTINYI